MFYIPGLISRWYIMWEGIRKIESAVDTGKLVSNASLHRLWPRSSSINTRRKWTELRDPRARPDLLNQNTHGNTRCPILATRGYPTGWCATLVNPWPLIYTDTHIFGVTLSESRHSPTNQEYVNFLNLFFASLWHILDFISLTCLLTLSLFPI